MGRVWSGLGVTSRLSPEPEIPFRSETNKQFARNQAGGGSKSLRASRRVEPVQSAPRPGQAPVPLFGDANDSMMESP